VILLKSALERSERKKQDREESAFSYGIRETKKRENSKRFPRDSILLVVFELASSENESKKDFPRAVV
jgi:hypothetical protein